MRILDARLENGQPHSVVVLVDHVPLVAELRYEKHPDQSGTLYVAERGGYVSYWFVNDEGNGPTVDLQMSDGTTETVVSGGTAFRPEEVAARRPDLDPRRILVKPARATFERRHVQPAAAAVGHVTGRLYQDLVALAIRRDPHARPTPLAGHVYHVADAFGIKASWRIRWNSQGGVFQAEPAVAGRPAWTAPWEDRIFADSMSGLEQQIGQIPRAIVHDLRTVATNARPWGRTWGWGPRCWPWPPAAWRTSRAVARPSTTRSTTCVRRVAGSGSRSARRCAACSAPGGRSRCWRCSPSWRWWC
jgi:hypothetical protein